MATSAVKQLEEKLELVNDKVKSNVVIVTPKEVGQDFLLHIAKKKFKELTPNISKRAGAKEDNTLVRCHVAPTLIGCVQGYAALAIDAMELVAGGTDQASAIYKGGLYIHKVPFEACLKPNKKMVYDAELTDEHWLTPYNEDTVTFPASIIGKIVPLETKIINLANRYPITVLNIVIEITSKDDKIILFKDIILAKGYYQLDVVDDNKKPLMYVENFKEIDKGMFDSLTKLKVANLSYQDKPAFNKW